MTTRTVVINPVEPALLSLRAPLGVDLVLDLTFRNQQQAAVNPDTLLPQLAILPRSSKQVFAYDVVTSNGVEGAAQVQVPGTALTDFNGYNLELYVRRPAVAEGDPPVPTGMLAKGVLRLEGSAFFQMGPYSMISVPVVVGPVGPQGVQGIQGPVGPIGDTGQRGSVWTTGPGAPIPMGGELPGDMYLDELSGDVWRWDAATGWVKGTF